MPLGIVWGRKTLSVNVMAMAVQLKPTPKSQWIDIPATRAEIIEIKQKLTDAKYAKALNLRASAEQSKNAASRHFEATKTELEKMLKQKKFGRRVKIGGSLLGIASTALIYVNASADAKEIAKPEYLDRDSNNHAESAE